MARQRSPVAFLYGHAGCELRAFADSVESGMYIWYPQSETDASVDATLEELALAHSETATPILCPEVKSSGWRYGQHGFCGKTCWLF